MHLLYRSKRRSHWLLPMAATIILLLSACSGQLANTNWSGMSTDGSKVYLAFGPRVLAYDTETESQSWIFPAEGDSVQFFSAPSAAEGQVRPRRRLPRPLREVRPQGLTQKRGQSNFSVTFFGGRPRTGNRTDLPSVVSISFKNVSEPTAESELIASRRRTTSRWWARFLILNFPRLY